MIKYSTSRSRIRVTNPLHRPGWSVRLRRNIAKFWAYDNGLKRLRRPQLIALSRLVS